MLAASGQTDSAGGQSVTLSAESFFATMLKICIGLIAVAFAVGIVQTPAPWGMLSLAPTELMLAFLGAIPLFLVIYSSGHFNEFVVSRVGPHLVALSVPKLLALAALVAVAEELTFRGLFPCLLQDMGPVWAIVASNALYACCYGVNKGGWVTMFLFGGYLSALMTAGDHTNLVRPLIAHTVFLMVLLPMLANSMRSRIVTPSSAQSELDSPANTESTPETSPTEEPSNN